MMDETVRKDAHSMRKNILGGLSAGILISIGGTVFLSCENRYVGAILFSVALLCICIKGYLLFTGRVGFMPQNHAKADWNALLLGLLGNALGTVAFGALIAFAIPAVGPAAKTLCESKLAQTVPQALVRALMCGILMYLAVSIYREQKSLAGIFFCVPVFILSGFEHSIADIFYFAASGIRSLRALGYLLVIIAGNAAGGVLLPFIKKWQDK